MIQEPAYRDCSRCRRLSLECKISTSFKRVGKRSKNAEMEREINELRRQLACQQSSPIAHGLSIKTTVSDTASPKISNIPSHLDQYINSEEAVASLLDLRSGVDGVSHLRSPNGQPHPIRRLESVTLSQDQVQELFNR